MKKYRRTVVGDVPERRSPRQDFWIHNPLHAHFLAMEQRTTRSHCSTGGNIFLLTEECFYAGDVSTSHIPFLPASSIQWWSKIRLRGDSLKGGFTSYLWQCNAAKSLPELLNSHWYTIERTLSNVAKATCRNRIRSESSDLRGVVACKGILSSTNHCRSETKEEGCVR